MHVHDPCLTGPENDFLPELELHDESHGGRFSGGKLGPVAAEHLACALGANEVLTSLNLGDNEIGDEGAAHIARALKLNRTLTAIDLYKNGLGDAGAAHVAAALEVNSTLLSVDMAGNAIGAEPADALRAAWGKRDRSKLIIN